MLTRLLWTVIPALALLAPAEELTPPKASATPEEAVERFTAAERAGDLDAAAAHASGPQRGAWQAMATLIRATHAFEDALDQQFGKDPSHRRMFDVRADMKALRSVAVHEKKELAPGRVRLTLWKTRRGAGGKDTVTEETVTAVKEEAGWKLTLPLPFTAGKSRSVTRKDGTGKDVTVMVRERTLAEPTPAQADALCAMVGKAATTIHGLTGDVAKGKYATRKEALAAFLQALRPPQPPKKAP